MIDQPPTPSRRPLRQLALALLLAASPVVGRAAETPGEPIKIGVLTDLSSVYADNSGPGSVLAARMAVEDFGGTLDGRPITILQADHQNKVDVGTGVVRRWLEVDGVDAVADVANSGVALAVQEMTRKAGKAFLATGAATSRLTGDACSPTTVQWTYDTYALAKGTSSALVARGGDKWFFLTSDFAFGHQLEKDAAETVKSLGGTVVGDVRAPIGTADYASYLLQAQGAAPKIVGFAAAGQDLITAVKQAHEFGLAGNGVRLAALLVSIADINSIGLEAAQGLVLTEPFYWNMNAAARDWSLRFAKRNGGKVPTMIHAGTYGAVLHYLKAMKAAGARDGLTVVREMKHMPIDDFMSKGATIRSDGRVLRDMYLFEVKAPAESHEPYDDYRLLATIPAAVATRPLDAGGCKALDP